MKVLATKEIEARNCIEKGIIQVDGTDIRVVQSHLLEAKWKRNAIWTGKACEMSSMGLSGASKSKFVTVNGYLISAQNTPASPFQVVLTNANHAYAFDTNTGKERPDVAEYFASPQLLTSGFASTLALGDVAPGDYDVDFRLVDGSRIHLCESGKKLRVTP